MKDKTTLPVQLQSNTEYTGSTCWFNLVPEQPSNSDDEIGVESVEFNYNKQEADSVSSFFYGDHKDNTR